MSQYSLVTNLLFISCFIHDKHSDSLARRMISANTRDSHGSNGTGITLPSTSLQRNDKRLKISSISLGYIINIMLVRPQSLVMTIFLSLWISAQMN